MKLDRRALVFASTAAGVGAFASGGDAHAALSDTGKALIGAWALQSAKTVYADGRVGLWNNKPEPYVGLIIYTREGLMSVQIASARHATTLDLKPDEKAEYFDSYYGYFGRYAFDEVEQVVSHYIEQALIPNEIGITYRRKVALEGDILTLTTLNNRNSPSGSFNRLVWKRVVP